MESHRTGQCYDVDKINTPKSQVNFKKARMYRIPPITRENLHDALKCRVTQHHITEEETDHYRREVASASQLTVHDNTDVDSNAFVITGSPIQNTTPHISRSPNKSPHNNNKATYSHAEQCPIDPTLPQEIATGESNHPLRPISKGDHMIDLIGIREAVDTVDHKFRTPYHPRRLPTSLSFSEMRNKRSVIHMSRNKDINAAYNTNIYYQSKKQKIKLTPELSSKWCFLPSKEVREPHQMNRKRIELEALKRASEGERTHIGRLLFNEGHLDNNMIYRGQEPMHKALEVPTNNSVYNYSKRNPLDLLLVRNTKEDKRSKRVSDVSVYVPGTPDSIGVTRRTPNIEGYPSDSYHPYTRVQLDYSRNKRSKAEAPIPYEELPLRMYRTVSRHLLDHEQELSQDEQHRRRVEKEIQSSIVLVPSSQEDEKICWSLNESKVNKLSFLDSGRESGSGRESRYSQSSLSSCSVTESRHLQLQCQGNSITTSSAPNYTDEGNTRRQSGSRISPTRRKGRIIMIDRFTGLLFDEDIKMPVPFDLGIGAHLSSTFAISDEVMYNMCTVDGGGISGDGLGERGRYAVRLMTVTSKNKVAAKSMTNASDTDCNRDNREKYVNDSDVICSSLTRTDVKSVSFLHGGEDVDDNNESGLNVTRHSGKLGSANHHSVLPTEVAITPVVTNNIVETEIQSLYDRLTTLLPNRVMPLETLLDSWNDGDYEESDASVHEPPFSHQLICNNNSTFIKDDKPNTTPANATLMTGKSITSPTSVQRTHIEGFGLEYYTILQRIRGEIAIARATGVEVNISGSTGANDSRSSLDSVTSTVAANATDPMIHHESRLSHVYDSLDDESIAASTESAAKMSMLVSPRFSESREVERIVQMCRHINERTGTSAGLAQLLFTGRVDPYFECSETANDINYNISVDTKDGKKMSTDTPKKWRIDYSNRSVFDQVPKPRASQKVIDQFLSSKSSSRRRIGHVQAGRRVL